MDEAQIGLIMILIRINMDISFKIKIKKSRIEEVDIYPKRKDIYLATDNR